MFITIPWKWRPSSSKSEKKQRVFGLIPNFYVSYESDPAPLPAKMKLELAFKVSVDPVTAAGTLFVASAKQAANSPKYGQGWGAYGAGWSRCCRWLFRHHDWRRHTAFVVAPGSALLLSGNRHHRLSNPPCHVQSVCFPNVPVKCPMKRRLETHSGLHNDLLEDLVAKNTATFSGLNHQLLPSSTCAMV